MADVEKEYSEESLLDVTGNIETNDSSRKSTSMLQFPMHLSMSSVTAREWYHSKRERIRPWSLFINTNKFKMPQSFSRFNKRVVKNIEYFQSNYMFVFLGLILYCLITSPLLLIAVAVCLGACYIITLKNAERKITIMNHEVSLSQQFGLVFLCSFPLFYIAGAGAAVFWVLGASFFVIMLHAMFFNIESVLEPDEEIELTMEHV